MRTRITLPLALALVATATLRGDDGPAPVASARNHVLALRLRPGQDLRRELMRVVESQGLTAVAVETCVGSLTRVTLRYANQPEPVTLEGHFEIVSLVGTLEPGGGHLHISVSDGEGRTLGGHLMDGSAVYTTAEVVLLSLDDVRFSRAPDPQTTYRELAIEALR